MQSLIEQLQTVQVSGAEKAKIRRQISNWMKLSKVIYDTEDIDYLSKLFKVELDGECRPYMVNRMYSRISRLRSTIEKKALSAIIHSQNRRGYAERKSDRAVLDAADQEAGWQELQVGEPE